MNAIGRPFDYSPCGLTTFTTKYPKTSGAWLCRSIQARIIEFQSARLVKNGEDAVWAFLTRVFDCGFTRAKHAGSSTGCLSDNPKTLRVPTEQKIRCSGRRQLSRKISAGNEVE